MNAGDFPQCEWPEAAKAARFWNCADDSDRRRAAKDRIEEITKQLNAGRGLTNKKRRELYHEADRLERMFNLGRYSLVAEVDHKRKEKRLKAEEKKLRWLGRKADEENSQ
jgi:hypothetical protein